MGLSCFLTGIGCTRNIKTVPMHVKILFALVILFIFAMIIMAIFNGSKLTNIPSYTQIGVGIIILVLGMFISYQMELHGYDLQNLTEMNRFLKKSNTL